MVSILVPVYNREAFLAACLESACAQTVRDFEVVVVDNASTDGTWDICRQFAGRDSRVRIFRNAENLGPVRNWRRCFDEARGELGKVLFSDDLMSSDFLAKTTPYLEDPEIGFVFANCEIGSAPGGGQIRFQWNHRIGKASSAEFIRDALRGRDVPVSPGAAIFRLADLRRNLIISADSAQHGAGPDLLLYLLTAAQYPAIAHIDEPSAFFRWHPGSISHEKLAELADCYTQAQIVFASRPEGRAYRHRIFARAWLRRYQKSWRRSVELKNTRLR
ncbi:MAG: glycosyltransferase [Acidobacteriota bacterium]|nr:glycosyltransferase [Acidobacteriota bacterium]